MADGPTLQLVCVPELGTGSAVCPGDYRPTYVEVSSTPTPTADMSWDLVGAGLGLALLAYCMGAALAPVLWIVSGRPVNGL